MAWALAIGALARGGRPDPPALRAAATLLDGEWRFRVGDDLRWAEPDLDDRDWNRIDLTAPPGSHDADVGLPDYVGGWMAHGHPGTTGYAWYRRTVEVPAGQRSWDILGPTLVDDAYALYWNGRLLGGSGTLGAQPRIVATKPLRFALPRDAGGTRGVIAVRAFMRSRDQPGADEGGMHTAPMLAPRDVGDALHRAQWERTIAGYIVDAIEPLAMALVIATAMWCWRRSDRKGFLAFAMVALALLAIRRLANAVVAWTDLLDLPTYSLLAESLWMPAVAASALAWNRWRPPPSRGIDAAALAILLAQTIGVAAHSVATTSASRLASLALFAIVAGRVVRGGAMRIAPLLAIALTVLGFFGSEVLDPLHVPGIWFPFGIGVSRTQAIYAMWISLLAWLVVQTNADADAQPA